MDWTAISPRGLAILQRVALPISSGLSATDVGKLNGWTRTHVNALLAELRTEIENQLGKET